MRELQVTNNFEKCSICGFPPPDSCPIMVECDKCSRMVCERCVSHCCKNNTSKEKKMNEDVVMKLEQLRIQNKEIIRLLKVLCVTTTNISLNVGPNRFADDVPIGKPIVPPVPNTGSGCCGMHID